MSEAHYSEIKEWERKEITRLTVRASDLLVENKRLTEANKELEEIIAAKYDNREHAEVTAENQRLKREIEQRDKYIKLTRTHVLPKRLGKLGLHNINQIGFKQYRQLVDELDKLNYLYPPHAGNYSNRIVREKEVYRFGSFMKMNWRDYYRKKVKQYNAFTNVCRLQE
jgi:hypothetical protein